MLDILILGCGPVGLALAKEARGRGLDVACMAPEPEAEWPQTLCSWMDELEGLPTRASWRSTSIQLDEDRKHRFDRSYGLIDNRALKADLPAGLRFITERATRLESSPDHSSVNGHRARIVVDDGSCPRPGTLWRGSTDRLADSLRAGASGGARAGHRLRSSPSGRSFWLGPGPWCGCLSPAVRTTTGSCTCT